MGGGRGAGTFTHLFRDKNPKLHCALAYFTGMGVDFLLHSMIRHEQPQTATFGLFLTIAKMQSPPELQEAVTAWGQFDKGSCKRRRAQARLAKQRRGSQPAHRRRSRRIFLRVERHRKTQWVVDRVSSWDGMMRSLPPLFQGDEGNLNRGPRSPRTHFSSLPVRSVMVGWG